jgi:hypothetical protein
MDELCADGCSSPCDILLSLPSPCFELGWRAVEYTHERDDCIRILKRLGKVLPWLRQLAPEVGGGLWAASLSIWCIRYEGSG